MEREIEQEILNLLENNPEELQHAKNTLKWLLVLKPDSDFILQISALGHDIERVVNSKDKKEYPSHEEFKRTHCKRSAKIIKEILIKNKINEKDIERAERIIENHEFGGNEEADLLRDADSLSNFEWCDDMFGKFEINDLKLIAERMFNRMSPENRKFIQQIEFKHNEIGDLIKGNI